MASLHEAVAVAANASRPILSYNRSKPLTNRFQRVQTGIAELVAKAVPGNGNQTVLTCISHQAPARWIPLRSNETIKSSSSPSSFDRFNPAVVYMGNYGGGLLPGDSLTFRMHCQKKSQLVVTTQGSNRVYPTSPKGSSKSALKAIVEADALLFMAPDPMTLFTDSQLYQDADIHLQDAETSSLCWVEWTAAGRLSAGERWRQRSFQSETKIQIGEETVLIDRLFLNQSTVMDLDNWDTNCVATVYLYGPQSQEVVTACHEVSRTLARPHCSLRSENDNDAATDDDDDLLRSLAGRVLVGVSMVPTKSKHNLTVVKLAAQSNNDVYRVLQYVTKSLPGNAYGEKIKAVYSPPLQSSLEGHQSLKSDHRTTSSATWLSSMQQTGTLNGTSASLWTSMLLSDSVLPTGSFAHASGIEAAAQLGLLNTPDNVQALVQMATRSSLSQWVPIVLGAFNDDQSTNVKHKASMVHAQLCGNAPACLASLDQGRNLRRLVPTLGPSEQKLDISSAYSDHWPVVFGSVARSLKLSSDHALEVLAYTTARDAVSAAVRLNLVGPLQSVSLLQNAREAAHEGIDIGRAQSSEADPTGASTAPLLDAIQPFQDSLRTRLFRS